MMTGDVYQDQTAWLRYFIAYCQVWGMKTRPQQVRRHNKRNLRPRNHGDGGERRKITREIGMVNLISIQLLQASKENQRNTVMTGILLKRNMTGKTRDSIVITKVNLKKPETTNMEVMRILNERRVTLVKMKRDYWKSTWLTGKLDYQNQEC